MKLKLKLPLAFALVGQMVLAQTFTLAADTPFQNVGVGSVVFSDVDGDNDKDVFIKTFFMPIPLNKYQEGKHIITIEKLFYEGYEYVNPERYGYAISSDSTVLVKAADSLIHIPFYIYR